MSTTGFEIRLGTRGPSQPSDSMGMVNESPFLPQDTSSIPKLDSNKLNLWISQNIDLHETLKNVLQRDGETFALSEEGKKYVVRHHLEESVIAVVTFYRNKIHSIVCS